MNVSPVVTVRNCALDAPLGHSTLLGLDERTVYRDWAMARAWLRQQLSS